MNRQRLFQDVGVGLFVLLALGIAVVGIMAIGKESRLFSPKVEYRTAFSNTTGLAPGSPVKLSGVQVGAVLKIEFPEDLARSEIIVFISVDKSFQNRIRADSRALLRPLSYLSIEKYIEVTVGGPGADPIEEGGFITPDVTELARLQEAGENIAENIQAITASMKALLDAVTEGSGLISELFYNEDFGKEIRDNLKEVSASTVRITRALEQQEGLLGKLLFDKEFADHQTEALASASARMDEILASIQAGEGAIGDLFSSEGKSQAALDEFSGVVASLREVTDSLNQEKGLLGKLLVDENYAKEVLESIQRITANMESITEKIDRGQGSVGLLLNSPEVYEGLEDVVAGIRDSKLIRSLIRKYGKKGAKQRIEKVLQDLEEQEEEGNQE
ncbi:MAG: MlaD family protein [Acidobacteria bacterium]|nr:MlaD family protein [Acidobacteriota bacterium]